MFSRDLMADREAEGGAQDGDLDRQDERATVQHGVLPESQTGSRFKRFSLMFDDFPGRLCRKHLETKSLTQFVI